MASAVSQVPNDKQQLEPMLDKIGALPEELGKPECLLADTGYFSATNVAACAQAKIEPLIAMGRQPHHPPLAERFATAPEAPKGATPVEAMAHRLKTPAGRALYALCKQIPEPVFGIIQIGAGIPSIFPAQPQLRAQRMEPRHHGLEHQADLRPRPGLTRPRRLRRLQGQRPLQVLRRLHPGHGALAVSTSQAGITLSTGRKGQ